MCYAWGKIYNVYVFVRYQKAWNCYTSISDIVKNLMNNKMVSLLIEAIIGTS